VEYKDYYKILGVERSASNDDIRKAYRKLASKYHPDVSKEKDAEARFKEVGEAYEVLRDEDKRASYDQLGSNWKSGQDFRPPPGWNGGFNNFEFRTGGQNGGFGFGSNQADMGDFSDFFTSLFGHRPNGAGGAGFGQQGGFNQQRQTRSQDQQVKIQIDLEDSITGAKRTVSLRSSEGERSLSVNIPKGVKAGQRIRLANQGQSGGDLFLEIDFLPHRLYKVDERDLSISVPITPWEAALGTTVHLPMPDKTTVDLKIPPNSRSGRKMRLKEKGIPGNNSQAAGDLYAIVEIVTPPADTEKAKQFYQTMAETLPFNPRTNW